MKFVLFLGLTEARKYCSLFVNAFVMIISDGLQKTLFHVIDIRMENILKENKIKLARTN